MCEHFVQFYKNDSFLIEEVSNFIGPALQAGAAGIVIATRPHLNQLGQRLQQDASPLHPVRFPAGAYLPLDAEATLARFMVNGWPDAARFNQVMEGIFRQAPVSTCDRVLAFGEMVALLVAAGRLEAALRLEELWNALAERLEFSLLCAYPMAEFDDDADAAVFQAICAAHTRVWPAEGAAAGEPPLQPAANDALLGPAARVIRDGFSMPPGDYEILYELKQRLLQEKRDVTKSGLLRAGLRKLQEMSAAELVAAVDTLEPIKQGRPAKH
jgi:hypothetical protein